MAKIRTAFFCSACAASSPKWTGQCPACGAWNTLDERTAPAGPGQRLRAPAPRLERLADVSSQLGIRIPVPIGELSRVLGGGLVPGSVTLMGGDPGIGKSTLSLQLAAALGSAKNPAIYVSGEESPAQLKLRAERLGLPQPNIAVLAETQLESVLESLGAGAPLVVIDSIQTMASAASESAAGSVPQVRECAMALQAWAKRSGVPLILIGHVTKDGSVAGPRVLEHLVDTVLYVEGERFNAFRIVRSTKNRFGATHEVGVFEMRGEGMVEVPNPSAAFLAERSDGPGSCATVTLEGARPLLIEVQALASPAPYGQPRRAGSGFDWNRIHLLSAVLGRRAGLPLHGHDLFVNVIGGLRVSEPASDLAVALAIASCMRDLPIPRGVAAIGEIGLGGEVRSAPQMDRRLGEAAALGFQTVIVPKSRPSSFPGLRLLGAPDVRTAIALALGG